GRGASREPRSTAWSVVVGGGLFGDRERRPGGHPGQRCDPRLLGQTGHAAEGELRVRDASEGERCRFFENQLNWNSDGADRAAGATGPTGSPGSPGQKGRPVAPGR